MHLFLLIQEAHEIPPSVQPAGAEVSSDPSTHTSTAFGRNMENGRAGFSLKTGTCGFSKCSLTNDT